MDNITMNFQIYRESWTRGLDDTGSPKQWVKRSCERCNRYFSCTKAREIPWVLSNYQIRH